MFRKLVIGAAALAVVSGGLVVATTAVASAKSVTIVAGSGSSISCTINTVAGVSPAAKIAPALKDDWTQSDHSSDMYTVIKNLPTTLFASQTPSTTSSKGTANCTGTITDGVNSVTGTSGAPIVVSYKLGTDPANPGTGESSCTALVAGTGQPALYNSTEKFTSPDPTKKIASTTITDMSLAHNVSPPGFGFSGGTISGSFAGGSDSATANINSNLTQPPISALLQAPETGADAVAGTYVSQGCQPTLKIKTSKTLPSSDPGYIVSASLKAGKGIKSIVITSGSLSFSG